MHVSDEAGPSRQNEVAHGMKPLGEAQAQLAAGKSSAAQGPHAVAAKAVEADAGAVASVDTSVDAGVAALRYIQAEARSQREAEDAASSAATRAQDGACDDTQRLVAALHSAQERAKAAEEETDKLRIAHQRDEAASRDTMNRMINKLQAELKSERDRAAKVDALLQARRSCAALTYTFTHITHYPAGERNIRGRDGFLAGYAAQLVH